jgi:hypothetical protein
MILDEAFVGLERVSRAEIYRRAVAADAPIEVINALGRLPEGEYSQDEVAEALGERYHPIAELEGGVTTQLTDNDMFRELNELYRTRHDTLRHGSDQALAHHTERLSDLEEEYLRRYPDREIARERLRVGARQR